MRHFKLFLIGFFFLFNGVAMAKVVTLSVNHPNPKYGTFSTYHLKVEPLTDNSGRVRLLESLTFTDVKGKKWTAPKGYVVDGATIPKQFQSIIGTPYGGDYVLASVIHDIAFDEKKEPWEEVHQVFYDAMIASGVEPNKATIMYIAVYEASARWGENREKHLSEKKILNLFGVDQQTQAEVGNMLQGVVQNFDVQLQNLNNPPKK